MLRRKMNEGKGCTGIEEVAILVVEKVLADKIWRSEGDTSICGGGEAILQAEGRLSVMVSSFSSFTQQTFIALLSLCQAIFVKRVIQIWMKPIQWPPTVHIPEERQMCKQMCTMRSKGSEGRKENCGFDLGGEESRKILYKR